MILLYQKLCVTRLIMALFHMAYQKYHKRVQLLFRKLPVGQIVTFVAARGSVVADPRRAPPPSLDDARRQTESTAEALRPPDCRVAEEERNLAMASITRR
ncbi:hypothetical protein PanWU01x14_301310 [Parasponia andersonii]|uniref:Uncharacterized protein n=1 Tax=Parasponia andersonii TaxID=3476 RepID=A0A2P5ATR9_PARAD|nr:hypothetical protein PanWU01x14_301310 [Parasponia andersonii]